jgi:hypothetical protein
LDSLLKNLAQIYTEKLKCSSGTKDADIDDQQAVVDLKERIKRRAGYDFPSETLTLYHTKKEGVSMTDKEDEKENEDVWMQYEDEDRTSLSRGDVGVEAMYLTTWTLLNPTWLIRDYFASAPPSRVIHELVKLPNDRSTRINVSSEQTNLLGHRVTKRKMDASIMWSGRFLRHLCADLFAWESLE